MPKITVLVEGQTEETFVQSVLNPYILAVDPTAYIHPIVLVTKRVNSGEKWTGGLSKFRQLRDNVRLALQDTGSALVTCMIDLYRLPRDFPGYEEALTMDTKTKVATLEHALNEHINNSRFLPYISTYEFEALHLSSPGAVVAAASLSGMQSRSAVSDLERIVSTFPSPEEINGTNPPSYRIKRIIPHYDKVRHGSIAAQDIGVDAMACKCEHFRDWVAALKRAIAA